MKGKENKNRLSLSDILKYRGDNLSGKERNSIEREFQKDPFAEEASEGFSMLGEEDLKKDIASLEQKLSDRVSHRSGILWYRLAASVAVLMILSSVFIIVRRNGQSVKKEEIAYNAPAMDIPASKALTLPEKPLAEGGAPAVAVKAAEVEKRSTIEEKATADKNETGALPEISKIRELKVSKTFTDSIPVSDELRKAAEPVAAALSGRVQGIAVKGKVISTEDNLPIPGATIRIKDSSKGVITDTNGDFHMELQEKPDQMLVADYIGMESKEFRANPDSDMRVKMDPSQAGLSEVVVVGYGVSKKENVNGVEVQMNNDYKYISPEPENGRKEFDSYIEKNLKKPATFTSGNREVVVLSFTVSSSGSISNIKVVRSPGNEYSEEAISLLKNGPAWKPAEKNGIKIDDDVRIRIVFK
jgi:TonB family protein